MKQPTSRLPPDRDPLSVKARSREKARALQLLLKQMHGVTRWSDGTRVFDGAAVAALRGQIVDRLIEHRRQGATPAPRGETLTAISWKNFREISRIAARVAPAGGQPARAAAETLTATLLLCARTNDPGSQNRARVVRRALRKSFPKYFRALSLDLRCNSPQEIAWLRRSFDERGGLVTRRATRVHGLEIPGGVPVHLDERLLPYVRIGNKDRLHIGMDMVRPVRKRDRDLRRLDTAKAEPEGPMP